MTFVTLNEIDLLKLIQGFLETHGYHAACRALELQIGDKEIPQDDRAHIQYLRNLILDGRWEDVLTFVEPLQRSKPEAHDTLRYAFLQQWYFELLVDWRDLECGEADHHISSNSATEDKSQLLQLETCVMALKAAAPSPAAFARLCDLAAVADLLTEPELQGDGAGVGWSEETARVRLASDAITAVGSVLFGLGSKADAKDGGRASPTFYDGDRLVELVGKGLCFTGEADALTVQLATKGGSQPSSVRMVHGGGGGGGGGRGGAAAKTTTTASPTKQTHPHKSSPSRPGTAVKVPAAAATVRHDDGTQFPYATPTTPAAPVGTAWREEPPHKGSNGGGPRMASLHQQQPSVPARRSLTAIDHIRATVAQANAAEERAVRSATGYSAVITASPPQQQQEPRMASKPNPNSDPPNPRPTYTSAPAPTRAVALSAASSHRSERPKSSRIIRQQQPHDNTHTNTHANMQAATTAYGRTQAPPPSSSSNSPARAAVPINTGVVPTTVSTSVVRLPAYQELSRLVDSQAIRAAEFSPSGSYLAIGSNSAQIRVCLTPVRRDVDGLLEWGRQAPHEFGGQASLTPLSTVWNQKKYHRGSIYCIRWNKSGDVIATGSNDKMVQLQRFDGATCSAVGTPLVIKPHAGTVRSLAFMDSGTGAELVVTGGGGDCSIGSFDSKTGQSVARMEGHTGAVNALAAVRGYAGLVASAGGDGTVKLWDARAGRMSMSFAVGSSAATAVAASGTQLAIGREDGSISLLDSRTGYFTHSGTNAGGPHSREVKSLQYAPVGAHRNLILSCSYDGAVGISQAGFGGALKTTEVAWHDDKVISARWCPLDTGEEFPGFVTASADRTVKLWVPSVAP